VQFRRKPCPLLKIDGPLTPISLKIERFRERPPLFFPNYQRNKSPRFSIADFFSTHQTGNRRTGLEISHVKSPLWYEVDNVVLWWGQTPETALVLKINFFFPFPPLFFFPFAPGELFRKCPEIFAKLSFKTKPPRTVFPANTPRLCPAPRDHADPFHATSHGCPRPPPP